MSRKPQSRELPAFDGVTKRKSCTARDCRCGVVIVCFAIPLLLPSVLLNRRLVFWRQGPSEALKGLAEAPDSLHQSATRPRHGPGCFNRSLALPNEVEVDWAALAAPTGWLDEAAASQGFVVDLGFNSGADSARYIDEGYKVMAVEANPLLVKEAAKNSKFAMALQSGQLRLLHVALAETTEARQPFFLNTDLDLWSSFREEKACNCFNGGKDIYFNCSCCKQVWVPTVSCGDLLHTFGGRPLYVKIDIELEDAGCLKTILKNRCGNALPTYVSFEFTVHANDRQTNSATWNLLLDLLRLLQSKGYVDFKHVPQAQFDRPGFQGSGPFGEEAEGFQPGWVTAQSLLSSRLCTDWDWCDIHARLSEDASCS